MYTYDYMSDYKYTAIYMGFYTYSCNTLHVFKNCLCSFLDKHLSSNNLSTIATISSLIISEFFSACFSCNNNFNLIQNSSPLGNINTAFETREAETNKPGDLSNFIRVLSRVDLLL